MFPEKSKILIVDDIPTNIQVLGNLLRKAGYEIAFTDNGPDAIYKAQNNKYDLILLDIMMPEMDGYEVCTILKNDARTHHLPIVFLTAKADSNSLVKGFELGAIDYVTKPFKAPELLARVKTHITLKRTTEELEATNTMKDKLMSVIAHDLRGPVGNFGTALEFLIDDFNVLERETILETMQYLQTSATKTFNLLNNLLTWANNQNRRIEFMPEKLSLTELLAQNLELLQNTAAQKSITLSSSLDTEIHVMADANMTNTILRNLLSNALKFSHPKNKVEISAVTNEYFASISVQDQGVGMNDEQIKQLFAPGTFLTTYGTSDEKGTGIGLKLCKDFVEKNGGEIFVKSEPNCGATFTFTLPLYQYKN